MARIARDPRGGRLLDPRLIGVGLLIGLAALTRNEAIYLGLAWLIVAWRIPALSRRRAGRPDRRRSRSSPGSSSCPGRSATGSAFGSPLPGQAVTNAFSITGFDIFAWNDPPTLSRYLAVGPVRLLEMRVEGLAHNFFRVLLLPGLPISLIGLIGLPWAIRGAAIRPVVIVSFAAFLVTSLVFPVATTWGTFLHAVGPGPGPAGRVGPARPRRRRSRALGRAPRLDPAGRLARRAARRLRVAPLLGRAAAELRRRARAAPRAALRDAGDRHGRGRPSARRVGRAGHHQLPDLAGGDAADPRPGPPRRTAARRRSTSPRPSRPGSSSCSTPRARTGRPTSTPASTAPTASANSTSR